MVKTYILKKICLQQLQNHSRKKRFKQYLQTALSKQVTPFQLTNALFTYTCFEQVQERVSIVEYHAKLGLHVYYTNLSTRYKSNFYIDDLGVLEKSWGKQRKIARRGRRKAIYCDLEDFYDMHLHLFWLHDNDIKAYFEALTAAPETPWWDEVIQLYIKNPSELWWRRGKNRLRIANEETGIYITVYTDTLEILDSVRLTPLN